MATTNLTPNGSVVGAGWVIVGGSPTAHAAMSDNSDATYLSYPVHTVGTYGNWLVLSSTDITVPALAQVRSVTFRVRSREGVPGVPASLEIWMAYPGGVGLTRIYSSYVYSSPPVFFDYSATPATAPGGGAWTQAAINAVEIWVRGGPDYGGGFVCSEADIDVVTNEAPVTVVTAPAEGSTLAGVSQPTITHTVTDPEGDAQQWVRRKVFTSAVYSAGGFSPDTSTAAWDSGDLASGTLSQVVGTALGAGTYRAYVKTADAGSSKRWGLWDSNTFTLTFTSPSLLIPTAPTVAATVEQSANRVRIDLTPNGTTPTDHFDVERSDDGGATWEAVRDAALVELPNLLTANESSIETDSTGWTDDGGNAATYPQRSTAQAYAGVASLLLQRAAGGGAGTTVGVITARYVPATVGQRYMAWAATLPATTIRNFTSDLWWANAALGFIGTDISPIPLQTSGAWTWAMISAVAPATTAYLRHRIRITDPSTGEQHYTDLARVSAVPLTLYDYEAPRGVPLLYRARSVFSDTGTRLDSAWASSSSVEIAYDGSTWFRSRSDHSLDTTVCQVGLRLPSRRGESRGVFYAEGRKMPVIHGGTFHGHEFGAIDLWFSNDAEWEAFETLWERGEALLVQFCYGDSIPEQRWLRLGDLDPIVRYTTTDMRTEQFRKVTFGAWEVDPP